MGKGVALRIGTTLLPTKRFSCHIDMPNSGDDVDAGSKPTSPVNAYHWGIPSAKTRVRTLARLFCPLLAILCAFPAIGSSEVELTQAEKDYLAKKETVVFVSQTRYAPFEFVDKNGQREGMMLDVARRLALELGFRPVFTHSTFLEAQEAVLSGKADILTSLFYSEKRAEKFAFTSTLFQVPAFIFTGVDRTDIKGLRDLNGKRIAMQRGDYALDFLEAHDIRCSFLFTPDFAEAVDRVIRGKADAVVGDEQIVLYHVYANHLSDKIKKIGEPLYVGRNCMAGAEGNALLVGILDKGVREVKRLGVLEKINKKWLGTQLAPPRSWLEKNKQWLAAGALGLLLVLLWVWIWNVRLRTIVRKRTEEIREREQALRTSEERLELALEGADLGIWDWNIQTGEVVFNDRWARMLGYSLEEIDSGFEAWKRNLHPEDASGVLEKLTAHLEGKTPFYQTEHRLGAKDGSWKWILSRGKVVERDENGAAIRAAGTHLDITDRKEAEASLVENERLLSDVFTGILDGICVLDTDFTIVRVNPAMERRYLDKTPLVGRKCFEAYRCGDHPCENCPSLRAMQEGRSAEEVLPLYDSDGEERSWIELYAFPMTDRETGDVTGVIEYVRDITDRRRAENALRESEQRYRAVVENSLAGIYIHQDDRIVYVNRRGAETIGYRPEDLIGERVWDYIAPDDKASTQRIVERRRKGETVPSYYQFRVVTRTGELRWAEVMATEIEHNGRPATLANAIDITDRKKAEDALRESEARYRDLFENAHDIIYTHDLDGRYISVNAALTRILGYTMDEIRTMNYRDLIDPEHLPTAEENLRKKFENGRESTGPYEIVVRAKDGTPTWFEITSRIMMEDGKPVGVHGAARDITDRKRAEEARRESEEKYRLVVQNANEGILIAQDGMLCFANPTAEELVGYTEAELKSKPFVEFIHPEDRQMVMERHVRRLKGEEPPSVYPFRVIDRSGAVKWVEISVVAVTWEGRPATLFFLSDITERRRIEEELARLEKLESLGILAGGIAHDFNNFLTAILGNIALARMQNHDPSKMVQRLIEAEKACGHAQGLTQQLLTFSKGGAPIKRREWIGDLMKDSCAFAARGSSAACTFSIAADLHPVEVDAGQIGQVINNLVLNAVQAMPQGGTIHVTAENAVLNAADGIPLDEGPYVRIVVQDQGVGIPERIQPRVFEPYFTTKQTGSGLGLATAYSVVKNHDGLITLESEPGEGTAFTIYLPAGEEPGERASVRAQMRGRYSGRVLLMDDNEAIRELAAEMLADMGCDVTTAPAGEEVVVRYAEAKAESRPFDVLILDLTVPGGMGGLETLRRLKLIDPDVKAIVSSGYSNDPVMGGYRAYGFAGVVAKPYTPEQLAEVLGDILPVDET